MGSKLLVLIISCVDEIRARAFLFLQLFVFIELRCITTTLDRDDLA